VSAIDRFDHVHVANWYGIPVYWPQEVFMSSDVTDEKQGEYQIDEHVLAVGGGSGEHPALILDVDECVRQWMHTLKLALNFEAGRADLGPFDHPDVPLATLDNYFNEFYGHGLHRWGMNLNEWPLETFIRIHEERQRVRHGDEMLGMPLEKYIMVQFGMFIAEFMPRACISSPKLGEAVDKALAEGAIRECGLLPQDLEPHGFVGLLPGQEGGRKNIGNKIQHGYSLHNWLRDNQS